MTVTEFVKKLKEFGYDENTELVFGMYTNTEFGDWKELQVRGVTKVCVSLKKKCILTNL
ncbi:MAG: hypothetical protein ACLRWM_00070 [Streptococcus sp.]